MSGKSKINLFNKMSKEELNNEMSQYVAFYRYYQRLIATYDERHCGFLAGFR